MIMLVDMADAREAFLEIRNKLNRKGRELGVQVKIQGEDIFNAMHQI